MHARPKIILISGIEALFDFISIITRTCTHTRAHTHTHTHTYPGVVPFSFQLRYFLLFLQQLLPAYVQLLRQGGKLLHNTHSTHAEVNTVSVISLIALLLWNWGHMQPQSRGANTCVRGCSIFAILVAHTHSWHRAAEDEQVAGTCRRTTLSAAGVE